MAQRNGAGIFPREIVQKPSCKPGGAAFAKARTKGVALNRYQVPEWVHQQVYLAFMSQGADATD